MRELTLNLKAREQAGSVKRHGQSSGPDVAFDLQKELIAGVLLLKAARVVDVELHAKLQDRHGRRGVFLLLLPLLSNAFVGIQPSLKVERCGKVLMRKCLIA